MHKINFNRYYGCRFITKSYVFPLDSYKWSNVGIREKVGIVEVKHTSYHDPCFINNIRSIVRSYGTSYTTELNYGAQKTNQEDLQIIQAT